MVVYGQRLGDVCVWFSPSLLSTLSSGASSRRSPPLGLTLSPAFGAHTHTHLWVTFGKVGKNDWPSVIGPVGTNNAPSSRGRVVNGLTAKACKTREYAPLPLPPCWSVTHKCYHSFCTRRYW
ncbi:unnamed protein product [Ectocarpus sp. 12 AP-2014]